MSPFLAQSGHSRYAAMSAFDGKVDIAAAADVPAASHMAQPIGNMAIQSRIPIRTPLAWCYLSNCRPSAVSVRPGVGHQSEKYRDQILIVLRLLLLI